MTIATATFGPGLLLLGSVLGGVLGCTSGDSRGSAGGVSFTAAAAPASAPTESAAVFLRAQPSTLLLPNRVVVDVVARGAVDLHGAAFRVTYDPDALAFAEARASAIWSKQALALAKEGSPGELAVAWAEKGETGVNATGETVIGTLAFDLRGKKGTPLDFKSVRSQLVDKKGALVTASWTGGQISAR